MGKYIWITLGMIAILLILAVKQAPKEPEPVEEKTQQTSQESGEQENSIVVSEPIAGQKVSSPLLVKGKAKTPENKFQIRLKDSEGKVITEKTVTYDPAAEGEYKDFGELLLFDNVSSSTGVLEVFYLDSAGEEKDKIEININF